MGGRRRRLKRQQTARRTRFPSEPSSTEETAAARRIRLDVRMQVWYPEAEETQEVRHHGPQRLMESRAILMARRRELMLDQVQCYVEEMSQKIEAVDMKVDMIAHSFLHGTVSVDSLIADAQHVKAEQCLLRSLRQKLQDFVEKALHLSRAILAEGRRCHENAEAVTLTGGTQQDAENDIASINAPVCPSSQPETTLHAAFDSDEGCLGDGQYTDLSDVFGDLVIAMLLSRQSSTLSEEVGEFRLARAARVIQRNWQHHREWLARRSAAARIIQSAMLCWLYRPGGPFFDQARDDWVSTRMSVSQRAA